MLASDHPKANVNSIRNLLGRIWLDIHLKSEERPSTIRFHTSKGIRD